VVEFEPEPAKRTSERETKPQPSAVGSLGVSVTDLTDAQRKELKVKGGVRVETVDGAAAKAGVREGDVILSLDNTEITSVKQFEGLAAKLDKSKAVTALVRRGDSVNFIIIRPTR
jgi:serine protease Do